MNEFPARKTLTKTVVPAWNTRKRKRCVAKKDTE